MHSKACNRYPRHPWRVAAAKALKEWHMEPRTRILFISYIIIVLAIVAIGVVPYFVKGDHKKPVLEEPLSLQSDAQIKTTAEQKAGSFISLVHIIGTNRLTKSVRFQIPTDGVYFEEQNEHLYNIMKNKEGRDIQLSYQKQSRNNEVLYNFMNSAEIR